MATFSLQRYQKILHMQSAISANGMIGTDQTFNYMNIEHHGITRDLLDNYQTNENYSQHNYTDW